LVAMADWILGIPQSCFLSTRLWYHRTD
jgi:hypothetical protein